MNTVNVVKTKNKPLKLLSAIRLPWLLFTLLVFATLIKLGLWQTARANEKLVRLAHIEQLKSQQSLSLDQVITLANTNQTKDTKKFSEAINDLPINITATFDSNHVFLLDNQTNKNSLGYRVFQVAQSNKQAFLVNLGWIEGSINRHDLPSFTPLSGSYQFSGHVRVMEKGIVLQEQQFNDVQWPLRVQQIEVTKLSPLIGEKLLPFVVYLDKNEAIGFVKNWHPVVMPPEKHQAYAFQWFSLAIAWLILMSWAAIKNATKTNPK